MNHHQQILILCFIFGIGIAAILGGIMVYMNASATPLTPPADRTQSSPVEQPVPVNDNQTGIFANDIFLLTVDASTGKPLGNVSVFLDGGFKDSTSDQEGTTGNLTISPVSAGQHTIRVTKTGYGDVTKSIVVPSASPVKIGLQAQMLVPVWETGSHSARINIVFVASGTTYNCANREKITTTRYVTDREAFVSDVNKVVNKSLFTMDTITDKKNPIPADYRERFNIYYYYDSTQFADAFEGCAGTVPERFWNSMPFADVVIILYPTYYTFDTGAPCEPNGCVHPGTGRRWMKIPADQNTLFMHECGHAIFGLIDTYCSSNTGYWQNNPDPNIWSSEDNCRKDATGNSWDASACRQIRQVNPTPCTKPFWRLDTDPDIMHEGYAGTFGEASTRRITSTFNTLDKWGVPS